MFSLDSSPALCPIQFQQYLTLFTLSLCAQVAFGQTVKTPVKTSGTTMVTTPVKTPVKSPVKTLGSTEMRGKRSDKGSPRGFQKLDHTLDQLPRLDRTRQKQLTDVKAGLYFL